MRRDGPLATCQLAVLDAHLAVVQTYPLVGVPNRARASPSGHLFAWTVFVTGDSYHGGKFSTRAGMLDTDTVDTLETFAVTLDGRPYHSADLNFWGVTFADDRRFYATMSNRRSAAIRRGAGGCPCSTGPPGDQFRSPRPAASTIRPPGSVTPP